MDTVKKHLLRFQGWLGKPQKSSSTTGPTTKREREGEGDGPLRKITCFVALKKSSEKKRMTTKLEGKGEALGPQLSDH